MDNPLDFKSRNILCPVDFSDLSGLAVKYAAAGARLYASKLILMHAGLFEVPRYFFRSEEERLVKEILKTKEMLQKDLADFLTKVLGRVADGIDTVLEVIEADPVDAILQMSEKWPSGLIILGTHGYTGMKRLLLGSTTESVIHNAGVPVFTVRQKAHDFIDVNDPEALPRIERILCACEITKDDQGTLDHAVSLAERFKARLTVLYSEESENPEASSVIRDRLWSWIPGDVRELCDLEPVIRKGNAADQIIAHAKEEKSDLIVIGARHRPFHDAVILGRTTDLVVRYAPAPVLVVPGVGD